MPIYRLTQMEEAQEGPIMDFDPFVPWGARGLGNAPSAATTKRGRRPNPFKLAVQIEAAHRRDTGKPVDSTIMLKWAENKLGKKSIFTKRTIRQWISSPRQ
jgi:hypothetical protein